MTLRRYLRIAPETDYRELPSEPNWFNFNNASEGIETPNEQYGTFDGVATRASLYAAPEDYVSDGDTAVPVDINNAAVLLYAALGSIKSQYIEEPIDWEDREENNLTIDEGEVMLGTDEETYYVCIQHHDAQDERKPTTGQDWEDYWEEFTMLYEHIFTPADFLPSMALAIGKDEFEHRFKGMLVDSLTLQYENGFLVASVGWMGADDEKQDLAEIEVSDLPGEVLTSLMGTFHRDSEDFTGKVEAFELNLENNLEIEDYIPASERFPSMGVPQSLNLSVELTISFEDESELEEYWGGEDGPTEEVKETDFSVGFTHGDHSLEIALPRVVCQNHEANVNERDKIDQTLEYEALTEHASGTALYATLINGIEEYDMAIEEE